MSRSFKQDLKKQTNMRMSTFDDRQNDKFPCCVIYPFKYFFLFFLLISVWISAVTVLVA